MKRDIEDLKKELVVEIKALAADIASSNSYVGLLANEIKFRSLQEKFINLKFLERKRYGLEIFDSNMPEEATIELDDFKTERESLLWDSDTPQKMELKQEVSTEENTKKNIKEETEEPDVLEEITDEIVEKTYEAQQVEESVNPIVTQERYEEIREESEDVSKSEIEQETTQEEALNPIMASDNYDDLVKEQKRYLPLQLDLNDQLAFQYQLFDGDQESMNMVIRTLNAIHSMTDSKKYLTDLQHEMQWEDKKEYVERLEELVDKRFE
ncbi:hypothetical protein GO491_00320 [Flavobacteriaceae bacterium Ap0902]|nr:hypothetical protein [Flavobacteriaceae bacterium Ap0902]